jgi:hypothetical protein
MSRRYLRFAPFGHYIRDPKYVTRTEFDQVKTLGVSNYNRVNATQGRFLSYLIIDLQTLDLVPRDVGDTYDTVSCPDLDVYVNKRNKYNLKRFINKI